jgi:hypothetical protein
MARVRVGQLRATKPEWESVLGKTEDSLWLVVGARVLDGQPMVSILQDGSVAEVPESSVRRITTRVDEVRRG